MHKVRFIATIMILACGSYNGAALAQSQREPAPTSGSPLFWNIDKVLDWYVGHVTRHYDLTETQEQYTRGLLTNKVKSFLKDYEKDVRSLTGEILDYTFKREIPPPEIAMEWAKQGGPLFQAIKKEIIDGNMLWRKILNDEQLRKHDRDLELMNKQFKAFEERLKGWEKGEVLESDFTGKKKIGPKPRVKNHEDAWTYYVRSFIRLYNLDPGQSQSAYSALRGMRNRARDYRKAKKEEFATIKARLDELYKNEPSSDADQLQAYQNEIRKLIKRRIDLERPLSEQMFPELKAKLNKIPTAEQKRVRKQLMAKLRTRYSKKDASTKPAATSQPATATAPQ
ncbi:MAG: hypothetical protein ACYTF1_02030 [Planctomycetota bacterium]|jgi:hypothetical protein